MKPKRKSSAGIVIAVVALIIIWFLAAHAAGAYHDMQSSEISENEGFAAINEFMDKFNARVSDPLAFEWYENSSQFLLWSGFAWLITVAYIATSKKNTIAGKEHGTAKWGGISDIRDLFAVNILKAEIKKAAMARFAITRRFARRKVFKEAEKDGSVILRDKFALLDDEKETWRSSGNYNKKEIKWRYTHYKKDIVREVKAVVRLAKMERWKPLKLEEDYKEALKIAKRAYSNDLISKTVYNKRRSDAKKLYKKELKEFYSGKGKIKALKNQYKNADALLTKTEKASIYNYKINNNILIIGGSGSGKTRGFVMPNILQAHSSFVITDPKGEILEKGGYFLKNKGYDIRVLNLDNKALSDCYNPFIYIHSERDGYEERVLELIEAIIVNTDGGERRKSSDPFWEKAERLFLQAIFFFVCDGLSLKERNMNTVLSLIEMLQLSEEQDNKNSDLDIFAELFARKYGAEHIGYKQFIEFRSKASGKTAKSIVISAVARLAPFRTKEVRRMFSYDTMNLHELGEKKMAIFVVVPPTNPTFNFIAGILFTQMFQELQYCATEKYKHKGQRLPVPVRFILDEFANTCTIPNFVKILAYARSFGIGIVPILQSLEQIKNMYKDEWGVIVDNCSARLFLGSVSHIDTLETISKMLGKGTFDKRTTGRTRGRQGSSSQNWDVVGRELLDPAEIGKLPKEDCLLLISGRNPFYSKKYEYTTHPNYRYTSDANKAYSFYYKPYNEAVNWEVTAAPSERYIQAIQTEPEIVPTEASPQVEPTTDELKLITLLTENKDKFEPLSDDELRGNYGETTVYSDEEADILIAMLTDEEADSAADDIIASIASPDVTVNENVVELESIVIDAHLNGTIESLTDEEIKPDYGEPEAFTDEEADMIIEFLESPEEAGLQMEILSSASEIQDIMSEFTGSIDNLSDEFRDTIKAEALLNV